MSFPKSLYLLVSLDPRSVIGILAWVNFALALIVLALRPARNSSQEALKFRSFGLARLGQAIGWALLFLRGDIHPLLSPCLGNALLVLGFRLESGILVRLVDRGSRMLRLYMNAVMVGGAVSFCVSQAVGSGTNVLVAASCLTMFAQFLPVAIVLVMAGGDTVFKRGFGAIYAVFLPVILARGIAALGDPSMNLFSSGVISDVSNLLMFLLMVVGGAGFLILAKEREDRDLAALAFVDPLTHLMNRRSFFDDAARVFERHCRYGERLSLLFLDLDWFKKVNDTYGHAFGDEVLKAASAAIRRATRSGDLACRFGGEEFVVLLPYSAADDAVTVAERIREEISQTRFSAHPQFSFTASVGIHSGVPLHTDSLDSFIDRADRALYKAKEGGRDRVVVLERRDDTPTPEVRPLPVSV